MLWEQNKNQLRPAKKGDLSGYAIIMAMAKDILKDVRDIGLPVLGAVAGIYLIETSGLGHYLQDYFCKKAELKADFFGSPFYYTEMAKAYTSRIFLDICSGLIAGTLSSILTGKLSGMLSHTEAKR